MKQEKYIILRHYLEMCIRDRQLSAQEASILGLEEGSPALEVEDYVHLSNGQLFNVSRIVAKLAVWWWLSVVWCTGQSGAHWTCPVRQPRHQSRWVLTVGALSSGLA